MVSPDLPEEKIIDFIIGDFEAAWEALANRPGSMPRGNFLFGRQAMTLLEVVCRLCKSDKTGSALNDLSSALESRDSRYFTRLPRPCWAPSSRTRKAFDLPGRGPDPDNQLIAAIFNLIRNGQAHQYQQTRAVLSDGKNFQLSLTGTDYGLSLPHSLTSGRPSQHLQVSIAANGDLHVAIRTDVLFLDLRDATMAAIKGRGLQMDYMVEDRVQTFTFDVGAAHSALVAGGHS